MTRTAYLDCFAGISGDMLLGALLDAGWPLERLQGAVDELGLPGVAVEARRVSKRGLNATHVAIHARGAQPLRHPADLAAIIEGAGLPEPVREHALAAITALAEAEARVHGVPVEEVHFHEVGAVDTLVDVAGAAAGLHELGVERLICSPLPWSHGAVRIAHGTYPVPPPATAELVRGLPVRGVDLDGETVTPTGAALARVLADGFGLMPTMTVRQVGYGAGTRDWPDHPNVLRLVLGETDDQTHTEELIVLACNLDDMLPEWYGPLVEAALAAGALDVWLTPAHMKKGRPAVVVEVLCRPQDAEALRGLLFRETTTLGVRETAVRRHALPREVHIVETPYGEVHVKIGRLPDGTAKLSPEHDDCAARAAEHHVSTREVWLAAIRAAG